MPPILALTLCTIFVLFLLRLDRKQYPEASLALWVPTIWFLLATSKALAYFFGVGGATMEEGSPIDRSVLILLFFLGFLVIKKRNVNVFGVLQQNPALILLIGFMLISISWSDMPFVSFKRWVRNLIPIAMALVIASESDPRQALQSLFRRMIYVHLPFSYLLINYYGHLGRDYHHTTGALMWTGVATQKNGLAFLCTLSLFYFFWTFIRRWKGRDHTVVWYQKYIEIFLILLSIYFFMGPNRSLTYSATALAVLLIGLTALIGLLWFKTKNIIFSANALTIFVTAIIIYGTVTFFIGGLTLFDPSSVLHRSETLTGRSAIWASLVPYAMQKPLLGHGFGGFWTSAMRGEIASTAHNGYLDIIINTGFIGLFLLSLFLISNVRKAQQLMTHDSDWGIFWFCLVLMAVARNIAESAVVSLIGTQPAILLFLLIAYSLNFSKQPEARLAEPSLGNPRH